MNELNFFLQSCQVSGCCRDGKRKISNNFTQLNLVKFRFVVRHNLSLVRVFSFHHFCFLVGKDGRNGRDGELTIISTFCSLYMILSIFSSLVYNTIKFCIFMFTQGETGKMELTVTYSQFKQLFRTLLNNPP